MTPPIQARTNITAGIENRLQKEIKKLAIAPEGSFNDLSKEALRDILKTVQKRT
jgi:hypothetical protein